MPERLVDIHAHVLPGIDDGPGELEGSLELLRAAAAAGTGTIAATPHLRADFPDVHVGELADRCQRVRDAAAEQAIAIGIVEGAEVSVAWAAKASAESLRLASYGQRGTDLLIETPTSKLVGLERFLYELRAKGYRVTLGHPERNLEFQRDSDPLWQLAEQGVLLQVNAGSLLRGQGPAKTRRLATSLVRDGVAHAIASDGHRAHQWRPVTLLGEAAGVLRELVGEERAAWMARAVPGAIATGAELPAAPPLAPAERPRGRRFGFGHR
jgi:protein-tyrosine phosphatase